ncbi:MAG TPA: DUF2961 domain-containing protein, partial [Armatimonadota bacterium]|nr:DUF2961 domain-containing protein [Armatimonadota bacterium]
MRRSPMLLVAALALLSSQPRPSAGGAAARPVPGSFAELADLRAASRLKPWRTLQASGYDRGGGFYDSGNFLREEPGRRYVLMETRGPGCIDRMWFTRKSVREPYDLLVYLDGAAEPAVRLDLEELVSGSRPPFAAPFAGSVDLARFCYVPIGFRRSCKVVLHPTAPPERYSYRENSAGKQIPHVYYQVTYRKLPAGAPVRPFSWSLEPAEAEAMRRAAAAWNGAEPPAAGRERRLAAQVPAGGQAVLAELENAGVLRELRLRLPEGTTAEGLRLRMTWDGAVAPAVDVPLGLFFAAPDPHVPVRGLWTGTRDGEYCCRLPMPFRKSARIAVRS